MLKRPSLKIILGPVLKGSTASVILLLVYFSVTSFVSGWEFSLSQFSEFWYFIVTLSFGFGAQLGLYTYLKKLINKESGSRKILTVSGTTSTVAMISCCSHYLVNILPFIGITGFLTVISQYQIQFFWVGLIFNLLGILYITNKILNIKKFNK
ncbi:MAG: hypothetical protein HYT08_03815 [Candidatus Levybacteria bacterium]|nr:hypothetical protein [Candidatus Levybacteria bacterium]